MILFVITTFLSATLRLTKKLTVLILKVIIICYIGHAIVNDYSFSKVNSYKIISDAFPDNTSDHLPLLTTIQLAITPIDVNHPNINCRKLLKILLFILKMLKHL